MKQDLSDEIIVSSDLDTFRQDEAKNMELNCEHDTRRDYCSNTTSKYVEIIEFTHFVEFWSFNRISEYHREKVFIDRITVAIALEVDTGNTKTPNNES